MDFRVRPNLAELAGYLGPRLERIHADTLGSFGAYRAPTDTLDTFLSRMDDAGIDVGVVAARSRAASADWRYTRSLVLDGLEAADGRLVGVAGLDLADIPGAVREARTALVDEPFVGVSFDPFQLGRAADDEALYPIYEACAELGGITIVTLGGLPGVPAPVACSDPLAIDRVAQRYPELTVVASHAGWPFTNEMVAVAWRNRNVYYENSFYHSAPGTDVLVDAANTMIPAKTLYASAYPFAPMRETLEAFSTLGFADDVLERILWRNPAEVLSAACERLGKNALVPRLQAA